MTAISLLRPSALRRALVPAMLGALASACHDARPMTPVPGGNPDRGKQQIVAYGCGACHVIPGVGQAQGLVGPPLNSFARRSYIAGEIPNSAANLVRWITVPQAIEPGTAMPNLGVSEGQARDIAAYLYTLR
jgi:cytochrome c1